METTTNYNIPVNLGFTVGDIDPDCIMTENARKQHINILNNEIKERLKNQLNVTWYPSSNTALQPYNNEQTGGLNDSTASDIANNVWEDYIDGELVEFKDSDLKE